MVKHTQTIRRLLSTNSLSVFEHFVGLTLKGLKHQNPSKVKKETSGIRKKSRQSNISSKAISYNKFT